MPRITIAQAQRLISRLEGDVGKLAKRLRKVVSFREDCVPAFSFGETLSAWKLQRERLVRLKSARTLANARTSIEFEGRVLTLVEAVILLGELKGEQTLYTEFAIRTGSERVDDSRYEDGRYVSAHREVQWVAKVTEPERDRQLTDLQDRFDALNGAVETANHSIWFEWADPAE